MREAMLSAKAPWQEGSLRIIALNREIVAGPLIGEEGIVTAQLTAQAVVKGRQILDSGGHHSRPDGLRLEVLGPSAAASR
ncbi:hypothetical protein [Lichenicoccus sp.]|uniref:hypothetical protein n=1 Tax=Lichenicoccus sp. TaxID=2781899 RepID=UPI003D0CA522